MAKLLVIAPHMDDEAISCGGILQWNSLLAGKSNTRVLTVFGRTYTCNEDPATDQMMQDRQTQHYADALAILGASSAGSLYMREGEPQESGYYRLLKRIEKVLAEEDPDMVVIPSASDLNQDHRHLNHVCKIALRPANLRHVKVILEAHALDGQLERPNYFVRMSADMLKGKQEAIACYTDEVRVAPHPRCPHNVEAQARVVGSLCGNEFAEGYTVHLHKSF